MTELAPIEIHERGDLVVACVSGEIDLSNVAPVRRRVTRGISNVATGLIVDLSDTTHLDSSGVYLLFELARSMEWRGQRMCVVAPPEALGIRILYVTGFHRIALVTNSVAEAVEMLGAESPAEQG